MSKSTEDLLKIVSHGSGVIVDGSRRTEELTQIASRAATGKAIVIIRNVGSKSTDDLLKIASVGKASVIFEI